MNGKHTPDLDPATDLRERWLPSEDQIAAGVAVLRTVPEADRDRFIAVALMVQPGKTFGIWEAGQPVVHLPGIWLGENVSGDTLFPLRAADYAAEEVGQAWLREQGLRGTVATAKIFPDGHAAVFESVLGIGDEDLTDA